MALGEDVMHRFLESELKETKSRISPPQ